MTEMTMTDKRLTEDIHMTVKQAEVTAFTLSGSISHIISNKYMQHGQELFCN